MRGLILKGNMQIPEDPPSVPCQFDFDENGRLAPVKSYNSEKRLYVRFTNISKRSVRIYWMDYNAKPIYYRQLHPKEFVDINTFITHAWIFKDTINKERFAVNNKAVFRGQEIPTPPAPPHLGQIRNTSIRMNWFITEPMRTLKKNALLTIANIIEHEPLVDKLEIPKTIKEELKEWIHRKELIDIFEAC